MKSMLKAAINAAESCVWIGRCYHGNIACDSCLKPRLRFYPSRRWAIPVGPVRFVSIELVKGNGK